MFRPATMPADSLAAIAVALVALPLSLAIATASGVPPVVGLVTAILGGIVVPLAGGSRLQVSGPAAAMTFLVFEIVSRFGMGGLATVTMIAAALQILARRDAAWPLYPAHSAAPWSPAFSPASASPSSALNSRSCSATRSSTLTRAGH